MTSLSDAEGSAAERRYRAQRDGRVGDVRVVDEFNRNSIILMKRERKKLKNRER